jgi:predicted PurR-regulated permease PerM
MSPILSTPPPPNPPPRARRTVFLAVSAAIFIAVAIAAHAVLLPFVLAILIAYVLFPAVAWVERRRTPRAVAILVVYAVVLGAMGLFVRFAAPRVAQELVTLRSEIPTLAKEAREKWIPNAQERLRKMGLAPATKAEEPIEPPESAAIVARPQPDGSIEIDIGSGIAVVETKHGYLVEPVRERKEERWDANRVMAEAVGKSFVYAQDNAWEVARYVRDVVLGISRVIFVFSITLMLAAYIMLTREKINAFAASLLRPSSRPRFERLITRIDRGLSGVVRGQLIICVVNGVLSAVGFAIVGLKYWPVMALVAAVFSLIPIFGSIVSSIPAVAIGLTQGFGTAFFVLVWIIGIHQLEANLLNPKIMGDAAKIHPVLVVFSLLLGEHYFGAVGALLAVPCMSLAKSLFLHFREIAQESDPELANEPLAVTAPPPSR